MLDNVVVLADDRPILDGLSLEVAAGELVAVIGPSGSGKTTLLRTVAGLETVASGTVTIGDVDVTRAAARNRNVAMVFQDSVLFPFMKAERNVAWPLEVRRMPEGEIHRRVHAEGRALDIEHILDRWPRELSAGHQQLVQVARAMVRVPAVFLLDEPLARIDAGHRARLRSDLRRIQQGYSVTTIYVTNDPVEAMAMSDRIAVVDEGRVVQTGEPMDVYARPSSRFVAELIGDRPMNFLPAEVRADSEGAWLVGEGFRLRAWAPSIAARAGHDVVVGVRPENVVDDPAGLPVTAERVVTFGAHVEVELRLGPHRLWMRTRPGVEPGGVRFSRWHVFDTGGGTVAHVA